MDTLNKLAKGYVMLRWFASFALISVLSCAGLQKKMDDSHEESRIQFCIPDKFCFEGNFENDVIKRYEIRSEIDSSLNRSVINASAKKSKKADSSSTRKVSEMMEVVKRETPKLRKIYNQYLKKRTFVGKIYVEMLISADGSVLTVFPKKFETDYEVPPEFVEEICIKISSWKFAKIKQGNTTVTIPFSFTND
jgi:hypothetical protein